MMKTKAKTTITLDGKIKKMRSRYDTDTAKKILEKGDEVLYLKKGYEYFVHDKQKNDIIPLNYDDFNVWIKSRLTDEEIDQYFTLHDPNKIVARTYRIKEKTIRQLKEINMEFHTTETNIIEKIVDDFHTKVIQNYKKSNNIEGITNLLTIRIKKDKNFKIENSKEYSILYGMAIKFINKGGRKIISDIENSKDIKETKEILRKELERYKYKSILNDLFNQAVVSILSYPMENEKINSNFFLAAFLNDKKNIML